MPGFTVRRHEIPTRVRQDLRPLSIGEIFDRAVTLFVRNLAVMVLIWSAVDVPIAIADSFAFPASPRVGSEIFAILSHHRHPTVHATPGSHRILKDIIFLGATAAADLFACTATFVVLNGILNGTASSMPHGYRRALVMWLRQPVLFLTFTVLSVIQSLIVFGITIGVLLVPFAVFRGSAGRIVVPVVLLIVVTFIACSLIGLALDLANIAMSVGERTGWHAFAQSFARTFASGLRRRNMIVASIGSALNIFGWYAMALVGSALARFAGSPTPYWMITRIGDAFESAFLCVLLTVYAIDVRVRLEGYDLSVAASVPSVGSKSPAA